MKHFVLLLVAAVTVTIFGGACQSQEVGEMLHESRSIQPEDARSVRAYLVMGAGELNVGGAADALMEADFSYNVADCKPKAALARSTPGGSRGRATRTSTTPAGPPMLP